MKISVIVPVFNCENTLRTCVNSLLDQDFDDYEIILVDDGSEDNSGAICDDYHNEYEKYALFTRRTAAFPPRAISVSTTRAANI